MKVYSCYNFRNKREIKYVDHGKWFTWNDSCIRISESYILNKSDYAIIVDLNNKWKKIRWSILSKNIFFLFKRNSYIFVSINIYFLGGWKYGYYFVRKTIQKITFIRPRMCLHYKANKLSHNKLHLRFI